MRDRPHDDRADAAAGDASPLQRARVRAWVRGSAPGALARGRGRVPLAPGASPMRLLVCGGAGFIGSTFVRLRLREHGDEVTVLDKLTYAGRRETLDDVIDEIRFVHGAIEDPSAVAEALSGCDAIVNFAAETHVDRSITDPE